MRSVKLIAMASAVAQRGYHVLVNETVNRVTLFHTDGRCFSLLPNASQRIIQNLRHFRLNSQRLPLHTLQMAAAKPVLEQLFRPQLATAS
ncbi:hypothetical protein [Motiliproteus sediminis]|uniref:hypothetical protein n=1 Tax=Motiliproteus sediminis TaxID=1468178 RepID=UPI001AF01BDB|nr:hypothetical protein [Motiliproteus sediminis]